MKNLLYSFVIALFILPIVGFSAENIVLQTDFGTKDGAVSAMKGVIYSVDKEIMVSDLTHEIPADQSLPNPKQVIILLGLIMGL